MSDSTLHVTEGIGGRWHYHLSMKGTNATALCGAKTMFTAVPLTAWGFTGELHERYCAHCAETGIDALAQAKASPATNNQSKQSAIKKLLSRVVGAH